MSVLGVARLEDLIGRTALLEPRSLHLVKTQTLDLSCLLDPIPGAVDRAWLIHDAKAHDNGPILEDQLLADAELMAAIIDAAYAAPAAGSSAIARSISTMASVQATV